MSIRTIFTTVAALVTAAMIAALLGLSIVDSSAQAQEAGQISVRELAEPGAVAVTWDRLPPAEIYRVGWISMERYWACCRDAPNRDYWMNFLQFRDVEAHLGETVIGDLVPGVEYAFVAAPIDARWGSPLDNFWSPWSYLTTSDEPVVEATPTPSPTPTPANPEAPAATATPVPPTSTVAPTATPTQRPAATFAAATPTREPWQAPTPTSQPSAIPPTRTPDWKGTPTVTPTRPGPTPTPTPVVVLTKVAPPTPTPSSTSQPTPTPAPTPTATPVPTPTFTPVPTATPRPTATPTPIATPTPRPTPLPYLRDNMVPDFTMRFADGSTKSRSDLISAGRPVFLITVDTRYAGVSHYARHVAKLADEIEATAGRLDFYLVVMNRSVSSFEEHEWLLYRNQHGFRRIKGVAEPVGDMLIDLQINVGRWMLAFDQTGTVVFHHKSVSVFNDGIRGAKYHINRLAPPPTPTPTPRPTPKPTRIPAH